MSAKRLLASVSLLALLAGLLALAVPIVGIATGRWRLVPILSGSMAPHIPTGSLAIATPSPLSAIRPGEVILFKMPIGDHHLTAHRVVRVLRAGAQPVVETKGDANSMPDPWRARLSGTTLWQVRTAVPLLGYAATYAGRSRFLLLALAALAPIWLCLRLLWRKPRGESEGVVPPRAARSS
jgi:signal peptidase I